MNALIQAVLPYILLYKYAAIFGMTFLAAFAFPIPPGTLLMASAAFASQGYMSFPLIVISGALGNIAGDNLGYWIARIYGEKILKKVGFASILRSKRYIAVERKITKNPGLFILLTRFEVFANLAGNLVSGLTKIPYRTYLFYEVIGETAQVALYAGIGYAIGDSWEYVSGIVSKSLLLVILVVAIVFIAHDKRRKAKRNL